MAVLPHTRRRSPVLGCLADDVTGATDLALNLVQGGMRVVQLLGIPEPSAWARVEGFDAVVVALKTRSVTASVSVQQSLAVLDQLLTAGIERIYFKYCSTFDSTDEGNIGPVAEALMERLACDQTIFCPAFPDAGRTVYQGHLFVGDKLLHESGMQHHPLNPMTDANLVRVLRKQTHGEVGLLPAGVIDNGAAAITEHLDQLQKRGLKLVIADTCRPPHLESLAAVAADLPLVTGGSGLGRFLPAAYQTRGLWGPVGDGGQAFAIDGRSAIIAGSCSPATQAQVRWMKRRSACWEVDVEAVLADPEMQVRKLFDWATNVSAELPLMITSSASPEHVERLQQRFGRENVATALERFFALVAVLLVERLSVRRLVLAGGETSGAVADRLGVRVLEIGPEICPGVPWTQTLGSDPPLALALKSGNFGGEDFFQAALEQFG
ncbi:four-carbon acid sugar kinase family protein [Roseiconus nitratireducens]|uniref:3-oxo-tetronate kinase n=1 Tax=Roseiconus nitratireducens TaxID=2605748 RepID=A0A5M6D7D2_9BACT|nr:3-oxo-tetronate kinase [Roseiconus nitratireducens]KAA5541759.1 four-carbon acid sugar kinase family protein [Roseiconus nitratireducens]